MWKIHLSGAKNSGLRLQAVSILTDDELILTNFPNGLSDAQIHNGMLEILGKEIKVEGNVLKISGRITQSDLILGAITAKIGQAKVPLPGGCKIGERNYDLHVMVLETLGAKVWEEGNYLCAKTDKRLQAKMLF